MQNESTEFTARYFDGTSLEATQAKLVLSPLKAEIRHADGSLLSMHPLSELQVRHFDEKRNRADLGLTSDQNIRLMVEGVGVCTAISHLLPKTAFEPAKESWKVGTKISALLLLLLLCAIPLIWQAGKLVPYLLPKSYTDDLGRHMVDAYADHFGSICTSEDAGKSLDLMLGRLMVDKTKRPQITIINQDTTNALALPGSQIILLKGLIENAETPEEVAGVLAHEIGHVQENHALKSLGRSMGLSLLTLMFTGSDVIAAGQFMLEMGFSRTMEEDADEAALAMLRQAGVSAAPLADFFTRMHKGKKAGAFSTFLSTHPDPLERAEKFKNAHYEQGAPILSDADWQSLKKACDKMAPESEEIP